MESTYTIQVTNTIKNIANIISELREEYPNARRAFNSLGLSNESFDYHNAKEELKAFSRYANCGFVFIAWNEYYQEITLIDRGYISQQGKHILVSSEVIYHQSKRMDQGEFCEWLNEII